ncbi:DUF2063 domain-containing protein [Vibrio ponticus]|uniref:DUF2063 domain-containing protein n=1 Tax=Vibrio ponticus TaxID=265668 RepID=A0A3N3E3S2_9VIBR|nr:DNA-binding domain-containing protein [Vibrio ponticus]ROV61377.1 DUF2063 domain-containing protein [Vibrio ponticus]
MKLAELQHQFASALHYQAKGEECQIVSDHFSADERMQIYRNNFVMSLSEVLEATYPMVKALLGEECFAQIARHHVLNYPLTSGDVTHYGEHFDQSLNTFPTVIQAAPYIGDVALFEWGLDLTQQRFSRQPLGSHTLDQLATLPVEQHGQIRFQLYPDVVLFTSAYATFALYQAIFHNPDELAKLDIQHPQQGVCACNQAGESWNLAVEEEVYQLLTSIAKGLTLQEIDPVYLTALNQLIELNLIAGFSLSQQSNPS